MNDNDYHEFDTVSHSILLENLAAHGLDRRVLPWVQNCLDGWAQGGVGLNPSDVKQDIQVF